ncbi:MAG: hypothetical protein AB1560_11475 [Pseudomonadota bacterium]
MRLPRVVSTVLACCSITLSSATYAVPDPSAPVVYLRTDCTEGGVSLVNCFTNMSSLITWISTTRQPSAANPLLVEIGPGTFGRFSCANGGYTTLRGSGREKTVITNGAEDSNAFNASNCTQLEFSELTIKGTTSALHTMDWIGSGTSTWSDVDIIGNAYGWYDGGGTHYWFGSRIINKAGSGVSRAYLTSGENWFFGSVITAEAAKNVVDAVALEVRSGGEVHVYGGALRAVVATSFAGASVNAARTIGSDAEIHIHGTGIDVISTPANNIAALIATSGSMIHAAASAYNLSTGSGGTISRIVNNGGHVHAPYFWEEHTTPPNIISVTGADRAVITQTANGHPGIVVYDSTCASKWYDIGTQACH